MSYNDPNNGFPTYRIDPNNMNQQYYQQYHQQAPDYNNFHPYMMNQPSLPSFNFTDIHIPDEFSFHSMLPPTHNPMEHRWSPSMDIDHILEPNEALNFPEPDDNIQWGMQNFSPDAFYHTEEHSNMSNTKPPIDDEDDDDAADSVDDIDNDEDFDFDLPEGITKEDLITKGIPDLNKLLKELGVNKDIEKDIKKLRRQFKNRGYAQVCREKKMKKKTSMKGQKEKLEKEIEVLRKDVETLRKERDRFKAHYDSIHYRKQNSLQNHQ